MIGKQDRGDRAGMLTAIKIVVGVKRNKMAMTSETAPVAVFDGVAECYRGELEGFPHGIFAGGDFPVATASIKKRRSANEGVFVTGTPDAQRAPLLSMMLILDTGY